MAVGLNISIFRILSPTSILNSSYLEFDWVELEYGDKLRSRIKWI